MPFPFQDSTPTPIYQNADGDWINFNGDSVVPSEGNYVQVKLTPAHYDSNGNYVQAGYTDPAGKWTQGAPQGGSLSGVMAQAAQQTDAYTAMNAGDPWTLKQLATYNQTGKVNDPMLQSLFSSMGKPGSVTPQIMQQTANTELNKGGGWGWGGIGAFLGSAIPIGIGAITGGALIGAAGLGAGTAATSMGAADPAIVGGIDMSTGASTVAGSGGLTGTGLAAGATPIAANTAAPIVDSTAPVIPGTSATAANPSLTTALKQIGSSIPTPSSVVSSGLQSAGVPTGLANVGGTALTTLASGGNPLPGLVSAGVGATGLPSQLANPVSGAITGALTGGGTTGTGGTPIPMGSAGTGGTTTATTAQPNTTTVTTTQAKAPLPVAKIDINSMISALYPGGQMSGAQNNVPMYQQAFNSGLNQVAGIEQAGLKAITGA